jgi:CHAT domain-containing protein
MPTLKSFIRGLSASLAGLLVSLTISPPAISQVVESQINRPLDPPTRPERNAAISELVAQLEKNWQGNYEGFLQRKITPFHDLGERTANLSYPALDAIVQAQEKSEQPEKSEKPGKATRIRQATTIKNIQRLLAKSTEQSKQRTAVVYIRPGQEYTTLIVVPPNGDPIVRLNRAAPDRDVIPLSQEFLKAISNPRVTAPERYLPAAQKLYQLLIQPIEATLAAQKIDTLMLCVGSGLRGFPFAALHDGNQFLVERYSLSLIPAVSLTQLQYVNLRNSQVLATGAASFKAYSPLPGVPIELSSIQRLQPNSQVLLDPKFTVNNVRTEVQTKPYQVLHIATHGEFRPGNAEDAFIQFWDNPLRLDQFTKLELSASRVQLLVLSACQTALGDQSAELGFAGLALYSGVPSVIGSLWAINDPGTVAFMNEFYWQLLSAPTRSEALRQAQIKMISGGLEYRSRDLLRSGSRVGLQLPEEFAKQVPNNLSSPYYWSPFVLVGNPW